MLGSVIIMLITCSYYREYTLFMLCHASLLILTRKRVLTLRRQGYGLREIWRRLNEEGTVVSVRNLQHSIIPYDNWLRVKLQPTVTYVVNYALVLASTVYVLMASYTVMLNWEYMNEKPMQVCVYWVNSTGRLELSSHTNCHQHSSRQWVILNTDE